MLNMEETVPRRRRTPSFSSSLLDSIYRSIDDSKSDHNHRHSNHHKRQSKPSSFSDREFNDHDSDNNLRRAIMVESWVEKQSVTLSNSASSSSESFFSSSETESTKPKPRGSASSEPVNGFSKTKLRAMKLYGELKKVKQPISPGGRIASLLNSIFSSGKKAKMCHVGAAEDVASSSETNVSKSCLSKPRTKNQSDKRSVRFYPVSVVLGEDSKQRVHEHHDRDPRLMPLSSIRRSFEKKSAVTRFCDYRHDETDDEEEDDDDDLSCSSSDLFELDHLVGVGRFREELPVYETTSLKTNQAIAKGLIL